MGTMVEQDVMCPKCGGATWDNRLSKKNPKAPDFKCRDKSCDGVIWPPKQGQRPAAAAPRANTPQPHSFGANIPGLDGQEADEQAFVQRMQAPVQAPAPAVRGDFTAMVRQYNECLAAAEAALGVTLTPRGVTYTGEDVVAAAATLFIQRSRAGL